MNVSGGEIFLDLLNACEVEYIFCSPGMEWVPIWEALLQRHGRGDDRIKYINCRHEMLAVSMAMGYAEFTGQLATVLLHAGVGTLHGSMAIRNAFAARVPMLVISGQAYEHTGDDQVGPQGWQWLGLLSDIGGPSSFVKGYVKWQNPVTSLANLVDSIHRGCNIAKTAPSGPVQLSVSSDLLLRSYPAPDIPGPFPTPSQNPPNQVLLEKTAKLLVESRHPVIITEYAARTAGVVEKLTELAELLAIPVFETILPYRSNFPKDHDLYLGSDATQTLKEADTILLVGSVIPWYPPLALGQNRATIIVMEEDPSREQMPHWGYPVDLIIGADFYLGLTNLIEAVQKTMAEKNGDIQQAVESRFQIWRRYHQKIVQQWIVEARSEETAIPISAKWFLSEARRLLPDNAIIVDETILHTSTIQRYVAQPYDYIKAGYGCLGVGLGEALGVKVAFPDRPVIAIVGDGAFNYNPVLAALGLCQEYSLPLFIMVMNNGGYQAMKYGHQRFYPDGWAVGHNRFLGVDITPAPDYSRLADVFNCFGRRIEQPQEIEPVFKHALDEYAQARTVLLDVCVQS